MLSVSEHSAAIGQVKLFLANSVRLIRVRSRPVGGYNVAGQRTFARAEYLFQVQVCNNYREGGHIGRCRPESLPVPPHGPW